MGKKRVAIVGAGAAGLATAWALSQHPEKFEVTVYEKNNRVGGNAMTVDIPQDDGTSIPVDISVTAFIPSVYQNYCELMNRFGIKQLDTKFSYTVEYEGELYAHDYESEMKAKLGPEIEKFQKLLSFLKRFNVLNKQPSKALSFLNPFNYVTMGHVLNAANISTEFRYKILKPMFVNFVLATNVFDMPASMFSRYLDFFDIEKATPMVTWDQGTRNIYEHMMESFKNDVRLNCGVKRVYRSRNGVRVVDEHGEEAHYDEIVLACNANQALMILDEPTKKENLILGAVRYESELHNHAIIHTDGSIIPDNDTKPLETRSNYILQYGARPDNYEITYIMHNQQPWAKKSDKPALCTYNANRPIDPEKVVAKWWFQHCVHDVFHTLVLMNAFPMLQGRNRTWYCGAHTLVNSQEHCFIGGVSIATQMGASYPFSHNADAKKWFNFYGGLMHGRRFKKAR